MKTTYAYFAGLIDGEGSIQIGNSNVNKSPKYLRMQVNIQMVDKFEILKKAQLIWGGYLYNRKARTDKHRATIHWRVENEKAFKFLSDISPYLIGKKGEAEIAMDFRTFVSKSNRISDNIFAYRVLLFDRLKALHHSIDIPDNVVLREKALKDLKKGYFLSEEHRLKLSIAHKGQIHAGTFKKGGIPWTTGRKLSEEHKRKIGKANSIALKKYYRGNNAWNKKVL